MIVFILLKIKDCANDQVAVHQEVVPSYTTDEGYEYSQKTWLEKKGYQFDSIPNSAWLWFLGFPVGLIPVFWDFFHESRENKTEEDLEDELEDGPDPEPEKDLTVDPALDPHRPKSV